MIVLDDLSRGEATNLAHQPSSVELVEGSVTDADLVRRLAGSADVVFHLAAIYDMTASDATNEQMNVGGTRHALTRPGGGPPGLSRLRRRALPPWRFSPAISLAADLL